MLPVVAAVSAEQRGEFKRWIWIRGIVFAKGIIVLLQQSRKSIQHLVKSPTALREQLKWWASFSFRSSIS